MSCLITAVLEMTECFYCFPPDVPEQHGVWVEALPDHADGVARGPGVVETHLQQRTL